MNKEQKAIYEKKQMFSLIMEMYGLKEMPKPKTAERCPYSKKEYLAEINRLVVGYEKSNLSEKETFARIESKESKEIKAYDMEYTALLRYAGRF